jgi:TRAP transporter TAXI family solute receptor
MKKIDVRFLILSLTLLLLSPWITGEVQAKTFLNIATSTSGGTFYAVGGKLADMITKFIPDTQATAEVTAGGVENARLIKNKKTEFAFMPGDTLYNAVNGQEEFKGGKIAIVQIAALYPTPLQAVTLEKTGIKSITDLKGKKVSIGAPGSSTAVRAEIVLKAHGLTLNDIRVDKTTSGESATQLLDRQIHAAFYASGAPMAAIMDVASKEKIVMLSVTPQAMAKIEKAHPDLFEFVIKAGTYPHMETAAACVANMAILACRPDINEDLVYQITKMIFERRDDFVSAHRALAKDFVLENAMSQGRLAPLHPGALKYYKEKGLVK